MTEPITLNLTLKELQQIDKYIEKTDDTYSVLMKIKDAYPKPKMNLENEGEFSIVSYDGGIYYRLQLPTSASWYESKFVFPADDYKMLVEIIDSKTHRLLEELWFNQVKKGVIEEPEWYNEIESDIDKNKEKPKTLYNLIERWWCDVCWGGPCRIGGIHTDWDMETSIEDLCDRIELWNMRNKK